MSTRTGRRELNELKTRVVGRDLAIVGMVADLRLMSGRQIETIFFSSDSTTRTTQHRGPLVVSWLDW